MRVTAQHRQAVVQADEAGRLPRRREETTHQGINQASSVGGSASCAGGLVKGNRVPVALHGTPFSSGRTVESLEEGFVFHLAAERARIVDERIRREQPRRRPL